MSGTGEIQASKNILILDNEQVTAIALGSELLEKFNVVCVNTSIHMWTELAAKKIDLVLLDLNLDDDDVKGHTLIPELKARNIPVIVISGKSDLATSMSYCKLHGASGFIVKGKARLNLVTKVEVVLGGGESYDVDPEKRKLNSFPARVARLKPAEKEVFDLYHKGMSCGEIALLLNRSIKTVQSHRTAILSTFCVFKQETLMVEAVKCGYLNAETIAKRPTGRADQTAAKPQKT